MQGDGLDVRAAFCEAFPVYVAQLLVSRGVTIDDVIADAIVEGTAHLDGSLAELAGTNPTKQRSSPLELFRQALRPIGSALATSGVPVPAVDTGHVAVHPWDKYQLSPGSPRMLGERAYDAHVRWGVAKAVAFRAFDDSPEVERPDSESRRPERPRARLLVNETDADHVVRSLQDLGYQLVDADHEKSVVTIVDIDHGNAAKAISDTVLTHGRVIVYGDAIDDLQAMAFSAAGVWKVVSRSDVMTRLDAVLPVIG